MSAHDQMRAMLDQLMGTARDGEYCQEMCYEIGKLRQRCLNVHSSFCFLSESGICSVKCLATCFFLSAKPLKSSKPTLAVHSWRIKF